MMRHVKAGWVDPQKGPACLVLDCGHVRLERFEVEYTPPGHVRLEGFEGEYVAPAEADCSRCEEDDVIRKRE